MSTRITRAQAIKMFCLECCGDQYNEVKSCPAKRCPLHRYRLGREEGEDRVTKKNGQKRQ